MMNGERHIKWDSSRTVILESSLPRLIVPESFYKPGLKHREKVLTLLLVNQQRGVTSRELWELDIHHPAGRMEELRKAGFKIATHWVRPDSCTNARLDYGLYRLGTRP